MELVSRKKNSAKSVAASLILNIIKVIAQFIFRSVFIHYLSVEYLGVNSAITSVINMLNVTELGLTSVIVFNLYKPVLDGDQKKINSIVAFYKKIFAVIGLVVLAIGLGVLPFLDKLVTISSDITVNITVVYLLMLASAVLSYFFSYRNVLFIAYQELYKSNIITIFVYTLGITLEFLAVIVFKNYYAYLGATILSNLINYFVFYFCTIKLYPQVKIIGAQKLDKATKSEINRNLKGMVYHKFSSVVLQASDTLIISAFIGSFYLGVYSNYSLFTVNLITVFSLISTALAGSIGNLIAEGNKEKSYRIYQNLKLIFFWLAGFCAVCLTVLFNPAIALWAKLGHWDQSVNWVMDNFTIVIIVLNFFIYASRIITGTFRECVGNFDKDRFKGVIEAIINIIVSIALVKPLGIAGVLIGTIVSCLCTSIWVDPLMVYKYHFKKPLWLHFRDILIYFGTTVVVCVITYLLCGFIPSATVGWFILKVIACITVSMALFTLAYFKTPMFKDLKNMLVNSLKERRLRHASADTSVVVESDIAESGANNCDIESSNNISGVDNEPTNNSDYTNLGKDIDGECAEDNLDNITDDTTVEKKNN